MAKNLMKEIEAAGIEIILVGTKTDLTDKRAVSTEDARVSFHPTLISKSLGVRS